MLKQPTQVTAWHQPPRLPSPYSYPSIAPSANRGPLPGYKLSTFQTSFLLRKLTGEPLNR